jgi:hypothetical protein
MSRHLIIYEGEKFVGDEFLLIVGLLLANLMFGRDRDKDKDIRGLWVSYPSPMAYCLFN